MNIITSIFLVFCLYTNIQDGSAIQCYMCSPEKYCEKNVTAAIKKNCDSANTHCVTIFMKEVVNRLCGNKDTCNAFTGKPDFVNCYTCNSTNLCNNQTRSGAGFVSTLSGGFAVTILLSILLISL